MDYVNALLGKGYFELLNAVTFRSARAVWVYGLHCLGWRIVKNTNNTGM